LRGSRAGEEWKKNKKMISNKRGLAHERRRPSAPPEPIIAESRKFLTTTQRAGMRRRRAGSSLTSANRQTPITFAARCDAKSSAAAVTFKHIEYVVRYWCPEPRFQHPAHFCGRVLGVGLENFEIGAL
jgi:hypothetical protein